MRGKFSRGPGCPLPKTKNSSDLAHYFLKGPKFTKQKVGPEPQDRPKKTHFRPAGPSQDWKAQLRDEGPLLGLMKPFHVWEGPTQPWGPPGAPNHLSPGGPVLGPSGSIWCLRGTSKSWEGPSQAWGTHIRHESAHISLIITDLRGISQT